MTALADALHAALDAAQPELRPLIERLDDGSGPAAELDEQATEQFLHAFVALMHEGIDGQREQRELVMTTAVPALVASGQSPEDLVRSHVSVFVGLSARMLRAVPAELQDEAAVWLAQYAAGYTHEVLTVGLAARSGGPA